MLPLLSQNYYSMLQSAASQIKALSQSTQAFTANQSLQKSLNPSLLLAPVFQMVSEKTLNSRITDKTKPTHHP
jgi:hypothetical protein